MAEGARLEAWDHTGSVMTLIANCNRDAKRRKRPYHLYHFHPFRDASATAGSQTTVRVCKENKDLIKAAIMRRQRERSRGRHGSAA